MTTALTSSKSVVVTGAAGFIGSELTRQLLYDGYRVIAYDALTYSGRRENLAGLERHAGFKFVEGSINAAEKIRFLLDEEAPVALFNLAAETHVDRSIDGPATFLETNVTGTHTLLAETLKYWRTLAPDQASGFRLVQVSTDEVYGSLESGAAKEDFQIAPNSPYAASKASADHFVRSYFETYGLPTIITRGSNTFGPRQFPEKLIPRLILSGLTDAPLPVYGEGTNVREWISVEDHASGIIAAWKNGVAGHVYNLGNETGITNLFVAQSICKALGLQPHSAITFVEDRPGHDQRYAMDCSKARTELGWTAHVDLQESLPAIIRWYVENPEWWQPILTEEYDLSRLGLIGKTER